MGSPIGENNQNIYSYQKSTALKEDGERAQKLGSVIPDELARKFLVIGNEEECIDQLRMFVKSGATHLIIRDMLWAYGLRNYHETMNLVGRKIIPIFS